MRKLTKYLLIMPMILALILTGCEFTVEQTGNKIFTNAPKSLVTKIAKSAVEAQGYTVTAESESSIEAKATDNDLLGQYKEPPAKVVLNIQEQTTEDGTKQVVIEIKSIIQAEEEQFDKEKSEELASQAVAQIKTELNKYKAFTISEDYAQKVPYATLSKISTYVTGYFNNNGYVVAPESDEANIMATQQQSYNSYNKPIETNLAVSAEAEAVNISGQFSMKGNYDQDLSLAKVMEEITNLNNALGKYPMVTIAVPKGFLYASRTRVQKVVKTAAKIHGLTLSKIDDNSYRGSKEPIMYDIKLLDQEDQIVVQTTGILEGSLDEDKYVLEEKVQKQVNDYVAILNKYQTYHSESKLFANISITSALNFSKKALRSLGYVKIKTDTKNNLVSGIHPKYSSRKAVVSATSLGAEGISLDIYGIINAKNASKSTAKAMVNAILRKLGKYDKEGLK